MMKTRISVQQSLFYYQLILNSIIIFFFSMKTYQLIFLPLILINLCGLLHHPQKQLTITRKLNLMLQLFGQSIIIPFSISMLIRLMPMISWNNPFIIALLLAYSLIMFIPYTFVTLQPIKIPTIQIIVLLYSFLSTASQALDLMVQATTLAKNPTIKTWSDSLFDGALIIAIMIIILMYQWRYGLPKVKLNRRTNLWLLALLTIFAIWFSGWNAFASGNNIFVSLIQFDIHRLSFTTSNILSGLEAGIAEEFIFRFAILTIIIDTLYNSRNRFIYAGLLSSLLFALMHSLNLFAGQNIGATLVQIGFAFAYGLFLSGIYLYSDLFYLPVLFHALLDTLVFLTSTSQVMTGKVLSSDILITVIECLIFFCLGLLLIQLKTKRQPHFQLHFFN